MIDHDEQLNDQVISYFKKKITLRVHQASVYCTSLLSLITIAVLFLAHFSLFSPLSLICIVHPFLHPFLLIFAILCIFLTNFGHTRIIAALYQKANLQPSGGQTVLGHDAGELRLKLASSLSISLINGTISCLVWNCFISEEGIDWTMSNSLAVGSLATAFYIIFMQTNYSLVLTASTAWTPFHLSLQMLRPKNVRSYVFDEEFRDICHMAIQGSLLVQIAQNLLIWMFGSSSISPPFAAGIDAQTHFFLFNFSQILCGIYMHKIIKHFMLEPISFFFPEKYEIVNPTIEQKSNMREVLHTSDPFLKMFAFYDLVRMQKKEFQHRREAVFDLSIPGNNPLNWNAVRSACLSQISFISSEIEQARQRLGVVQFAGVDSDEEDVVNQSMLMKHPAQRIQTYTQSVRRRQHATLRRQTSPLTSYSSNIPRTVFSPYASKTLLFSIEGIIRLLVCSLKEDRYGVTQKDNPVILRTILQLAATIDKYRREKKAVSCDDGIEDIWICEVENVINRSLNLYNASFKNYTAALKLSPEEHRTYTQIVVPKIYND